MTITSAKVPTFSEYPYFDDFTQDNNYYRILFKPGYSVQTRELNQIQSILQQQIGNLADFAVADKSAVVGGEIKFNQSVDYIKLKDGFKLARNPIEYTRDVKFQTTSGIKGDIKFVIDADSTGPITLYVRYLEASELDGKSLPEENENITIIFPDGNTEIFKIASTEALGNGTVAELVEDSIYYIKKTLINVPKQLLVIDKYNKLKTESLNVGILVNESVITAEQDIELYDNALGTPNEMAPGADRYKITGILVEKSQVPAELIDNFIEMTRLEYSKESAKTVNNPVVTEDPDTGEQIVEEPETSEKEKGVVAEKEKDNVANPVIPTLKKMLAKRTYDESGDYIVDTFDLDIREHLKRDNNGGLFSYNNGGKEELLIAQLDPGTAYIRGHAVSFNTTQYLAIEKARHSKTIENTSSIVDFNSYIIIDQPTSGTVTIGDLINLRYGNSVLGKAYVAGINSLENGKIKLFIVVIETKGNLENASNITSYGSTDILVPISATIEKINIDKKALLLDPLPYGFAKKTLPRNIQIYKHYNVNTVSGNTISISNEDDSEKLSPNEYDYFVYIKSVGSGRPAEVQLKDNTAETAATLDITGINGHSNINGGIEAIVVAKVTVQRPKIKTKSLVREYTELKSPGLIKNGVLTLNKVDGYKLISVKTGPSDDSPDITSKFDFSSGQTDTHYQNAFLRVKPGIKIDEDIQLHITYSYFKHSPDGDYFSVDSYNTLEYKDIPTYVSTSSGNIFLGAAYDFRPVIQSGTVRRVEKNYARGANNPSVVCLDERLVSDVTYYLPRKDRIMVTSNNSLEIIPGTPDFNPVLPKELDDAITIYNLTILPYTFDINGVISEKLNHKRYTMKDIGYLEARLNNVEEVALLNKLEEDTASTNFDDRFKSGYVVDNFSTSSTGDVESPHWGVAYDLVNPSIRPKSISDFIELGLNVPSMNNVKYHEETGIITLNYRVKEFISQDLASDIVLVQPYIIHGWGEGTLTIKPSMDLWKESFNHTKNIYKSQTNRLDNIINKTTKEVNNAYSKNNKTLRLSKASLK